MSLTLTPEILRATYALLDSTPPFSGWNLPDADDVVFKVVRDPNLCAWYQMQKGRHVIAVSSAKIGRTFALVEAMAHEMIHVHEEHNRFCRPRVQHGTAFNRLAERVCKIHGFDPKLF